MSQNKYPVLSATIEDATNLLSPSSASTYRRYMMRFVDFLESEVNWNTIPKDNLATWLPFVIKEQGTKVSSWECNQNLPTAILNEVTLAICEKFTELNASESTRRLVRSAINKLMLQAALDRAVPSSLIEALNINVKAGGNQTHRTINTSDIRQLRLSLLSDDQDPTSLQALVCVDLMLYMGFRQSEIVRLTLGDIAVKNEAMWLRTDGLAIKAHAVVKGNIEKYLTITDRVLGESDSSSALVIRKDGKGITDRSLRHIFQSLLVGDLSAYTPDDLRRTGAINALENGATIPMVQAMLRIKQRKTLASYLGINLDLIQLPYVAAYVKYD